MKKKIKMTSERALEINLENETDVETLRELVIFWQEKALSSAIDFFLMKNEKNKQALENIIAKIKQNK